MQQAEIIYRGYLGPAAALLAIETMAKNALAERRIKNAPMPQLWHYMWCNLEISQQKLHDGKAVGRLVLSQKNGTVRFDKKWTIVETR
ncbi:MAG TPA: hypothetical protein VKR31_05970 [Rhizomicrobium sp.]|nr:hypothetical protein [Rhizomicrobium sp.]